MERRYLIIPVSILDSIDFTEVYETSIDTVKISQDNLYTFVKYDSGSRPSFYSNSYTEYNPTEFANILTGSNWNCPDDTI